MNGFRALLNAGSIRLLADVCTSQTGVTGYRMDHLVSPDTCIRAWASWRLLQVYCGLQ